MTDIIASPPLAPTTPQVFGWRLTRQRFQAILAAAFVSVGAAFQLAYVAPYEASGRHQSEAEADGRDPNW